MLFIKIKSLILYLFNKNGRDNYKLLKKTQLFNQLRKNEFITLFNTIKEQKFSNGDLIIQEGDIGDYLYIIKQGSVKIFTADMQGQEIVLAKLDSGAYFGEQALLSDTPSRRNASVKALTDLVVLKISYNTFQQTLNKNENIKTILRLVGNRQSSQKMAKQISLLHFIPEDLMERLDGKIIEFPDQEIIFFQGDQPDYIYFILSGTVKIQIQKPNSELGPIVQLGIGQVFGELGILKNAPRAGTAVANEPAKVLAIPATIFQKLYEAAPKLQSSMVARQHLYTLPQYGLVTITDAIILGIPAVSVDYQLINDRTIYAAQAFDNSIFTMQDKTNSASEQICFQHGVALKREIGIVNNKIVSILIVGQWDELSFICGILLNAISIENWQIKLFKETGSFGTEKLQYKNNYSIICYCMNITRDQIENYIRQGFTHLDELLEKSNAGKVCGGCRSSISEMLGNITWTFAAISQIKRLTSDVRLYTLKPRDLQLYPYKAGQYIVISILINKHWVQRSFTLTSISNEATNYYEIAIKKEEAGYLSHWLFENDTLEPIIKISPPQGDFTFATNKKDSAVFFAAGIGITPAYAIVRSIHNENCTRIFYLHYSSHSADDFVFIEELTKIAEDCSNFTYTLKNTAQEGELTKSDIINILNKYEQSDFYICGPNSYMDFIIATLKEYNIPNDRIKVEIFTPNVGKS